MTSRVSPSALSTNLRGRWLTYPRPVHECPHGPRFAVLRTRGRAEGSARSRPLRFRKVAATRKVPTPASTIHEAVSILSCRYHVRLPVPNARRSMASIVSSAPANEPTVTGTKIGAPPEPRAHPPAPLQRIEAADTLSVNRLTKLGRQRRDEANGELDHDREPISEAQPSKRHAEVTWGDGVGNRKANRRETQVSNDLGGRKTEPLGGQGETEGGDSSRRVSGHRQRSPRRRR